MESNPQDQQLVTVTIDDAKKKAIEEHLVAIVQMLYDSSYSIETLDEQVFRYCSDRITFVDAWQTPKGMDNYRGQFNGLRNMGIKFEFDRRQYGTQWRKEGGRFICEGWFTTTVWLPWLRFPLRTFSIHEFVLTDQNDKGFLIYNHEELWSFTEMLEKMPIVGTLYNGFRWFAARFFAASFGFFSTANKLRDD